MSSPPCSSLKSNEVIIGDFINLCVSDFLQKQKLYEDYDKCFLNFVENYLNRFVHDGLLQADTFIPFLNEVGDLFISKVMHEKPKPDNIEKNPWYQHVSRLVRRLVHRCARICTKSADGETLITLTCKKLNKVITNMTKDSFAIFVECVTGSVNDRSKLKVPEVKTDNV